MNLRFPIFMAIILIFERNTIQCKYTSMYICTYVDTSVEVDMFHTDMHTYIHMNVRTTKYTCVHTCSYTIFGTYAPKCIYTKNYIKFVYVLMFIVCVSNYIFSLPKNNGFSKC